MRIGIISPWLAPEPAFVPGCLAEELVARGHEVRVLTGVPQHSDRQRYPGFRQQRNDQAVGGLTVRRVPHYPNDGTPGVGHLVHQVSYAATGSLAALTFLRSVDAVYVYCPPVGAYPPAALARLVHRVPTVVHVQDIWPDALLGSDPRAGGIVTRMTYRLLTRTMESVYRSAAGIAVAAPGMRDVVVARGADPDRVRVVLNWTDERLFRPIRCTATARSAIGHRGRCTVMHAGPAAHAETAIRAAAAVDGSVDVDLVLVDAGAEQSRLRRVASKLGATNVRFVEARTPAEMAELYGAAEYQLVLLRNLPVLRGTVAARLPTAFSCGAPVVVSADGDTADLVERDRAGLSCPPEDWAALADRFALAAVIPPEARAGMAERARQSYLRRMCLRLGVDQLEQMLLEAAASRPHVRG